MASLEKKIKKLPHSPGIYLFRNKKGDVIYVGKAKDLSKRVSSYIQKKEFENPKLSHLIPLIYTVDVIRVASEFDALLLEAKYIRTYLPKFNSIAKDDKSPIYITIPKKEKYPIISLARKPKKENENILYFGPFSSGRIAREILRSVRRVIPFCQQKNMTAKPCFYSQLGLCRPCPSWIEFVADESQKRVHTLLYRKNIRYVISILSGKSPSVIRKLKSDMKKELKNERFENAQSLHRQMGELLRITSIQYDPFHFDFDKDDILVTTPPQQNKDLETFLRHFFPDIGRVSRIECVDISTTSGAYPVGSFVTFVDGIPDRAFYRRFRIKSEFLRDDTGRITEVVKRRFSHTEWQFPDVLVVDGGKPQVHVVNEILAIMHIRLPVIGIAKKREQVIIQVNSVFHQFILPFASPTLQLIQRVRDEAHRFAHAYHGFLQRRHLRDLQSI